MLLRRTLTFPLNGFGSQNEKIPFWSFETSIFGLFGALSIKIISLWVVYTFWGKNFEISYNKKLLWITMYLCTFERIVLHALTNLRRGLYSTLLPYYYNVHSSDKNQIRQGHNISILMSWISHIFNIMTSKPFWVVNLNFYPWKKHQYNVS